MMREYHKFTLDNSNKHLLDLFYQNGTYLEIGSIDHNVLVRLLNFELIDCEDLVFFPLLLRGLGKFDIENENLKKILPFLFFERLHQKNKNNQLFITYGLLHHKDEQKREIFSPLALIPVNIYLENGRIFIQQIGRPFENAILLSYLLNEKNIEIAGGEKIDSPYALDEYCFSFEKHGFSVKLENYLTFAALKEPELKLERSLFDYEGGYPEYLSDCLYEGEPELYYSQKLTRRQRQAVYKAVSGDNLVIAGRLGTGKTTALFNIALNAIAFGKRVLYVSNMKESLEQIRSLFAGLGLNHYLTDLTNSFASIHQLELFDEPDGRGGEADSEKLHQNYRFIKKYVSAMTGRILDFRFIDIVNSLARIAEFPKKKLEIDDFSSLYKSEYEEIHAALKKIEENLKRIGDFNKSIWNEIPVFNNIKYPNQIFALIHQLQKNYLILQEQKETLEQRFGLKPIKNYAYLKSVFHDLKGLDINAFPLSWVSSETFSEAREEFKSLKTQIYQIQELEYLLSSRYVNNESVDIEAEMAALFGPFFGEEDAEKIDRLLKERAELNVIINKISVQTKIYERNRKKLVNLLNWDFPQTDHVLKEISNLNEIIQTTDFSQEFLATISSGNYEETVKKLRKLADAIEKTETEIEELFSEGGRGKTRIGRAEVDKFLEDKPLKKSSQRLLANLKKANPQTFSEKMERYRGLKTRISELQEEFKALSGFHYGESVFTNLDRLHSYFENLSDKLIRSKFLKFLKNAAKLGPEDLKRKRNYRNLFDLFSKAYLLISIYYRELLAYGFKNAETEFLGKLKDIGVISGYLENLYLSNERIKEIQRNRELDYVSASEYLELHKLFLGIKEKKAVLEENHRYRYLYGKLYEDYHTNINNVSRFLQAYKLYSDCFADQEKLIESLNEDTHMELLAHLAVCEEASENLAEVFKIFFKIFRDSVSKYYYSSFSEILEFLAELAESKDELISYLAVSDNLRILHRHGLTKLIDYILALENPENLALDFKFTYLETLKELYLEMHPYLADYQVLESCLELAMTYEEEMIAAFEKQTIQKIKRQSSNKFHPLGIRNLDYIGYIRRTTGTKHLFLTDTQILNNFLNPGDFDLILIDDAQLLHANHYCKALQGMQVIVAGEQQLLGSVSENLISRVSNSKTIIFDLRFLPTPHRLLRQVKGLRGLSYADLMSNQGIEIVTEGIDELILLFVERNGVLNVFLPGIERQRALYEKLANLLLEKNYKEEEIIEIFRKKLNICDLAYEYLIDADYNIFYLDAYYKTESDYEIANFLDLLMLCRRKMIVYDGMRLLESGTETKFLTELRKIVFNPDICFPKETTGAVALLAERLEEAGIKVYSSSLFSLFLQKGEKYYGVLVFWSEDNADYEILNEYRENYLLGKKLMDIFIVWSWELMESTAKVFEKIMRGMKDV